MSNFYVYVYIDPRNFEEFYFGKGKGSRKDAHLSDTSDSEKTRRIKAIQKAGLEPIRRIIARNLSEHDALLVEKTLLWKLGRQLTNVSSGHYSENFRPHDTLHLDLSGFDYQCGIYYFNIGECERRSWDECYQYRFISAGGGTRWRDAICGFRIGDVFAAYLKGYGYVGIGRILNIAQPADRVSIEGKPLLTLCPQMAVDTGSVEKSEYVAIAEWI